MLSLSEAPEDTTKAAGTGNVLLSVSLSIATDRAGGWPLGSAGLV